MSRGGESGGRVLVLAQPRDVLLARELLGRFTGEQYRQLYRVGVRAQCGVRAGSVDVAAAARAVGGELVGFPAAGDDRVDLIARGVAEVAKPRRQFMPRGLARRPPVPYEARGVAGDDRPVGHVGGHDRARADDGVRSDGHPVHDDDVRPDPDVVADADPGFDGRLMVDPPVGRGRVVEAENGGVCADAHAFAGGHRAAYDGERVDRAVVAHGDRAGDVGVRRDVGVLPERELGRLDHGQFGDEGGLPDGAFGAPEDVLVSA